VSASSPSPYSKLRAPQHETQAHRWGRVRLDSKPPRTVPDVDGLPVRPRQANASAWQVGWLGVAAVLGLLAILRSDALCSGAACPDPVVTNPFASKGCSHVHNSRASRSGTFRSTMVSLPPSRPLFQPTARLPGRRDRARLRRLGSTGRASPARPATSPSCTAIAKAAMRRWCSKTMRPLTICKDCGTATSSRASTRPGQPLPAEVRFALQAGGRTWEVQTRDYPGERVQRPVDGETLAWLEACDAVLVFVDATSPPDLLAERLNEVDLLLAALRQLSHDGNTIARPLGLVLTSGTRRADHGGVSRGRDQRAMPGSASARVSPAPPRLQHAGHPDRVKVFPCRRSAKPRRHRSAGRRTARPLNLHALSSGRCASATSACSKPLAVAPGNVSAAGGPTTAALSPSTTTLSPGHQQGRAVRRGD